jgi:hypothetical protein
MFRYIRYSIHYIGYIIERVICGAMTLACISAVAAQSANFAMQQKPYLVKLLEWLEFHVWN